MPNSLSLSCKFGMVYLRAHKITTHNTHAHTQTHRNRHKLTHRQHTPTPPTHPTPTQTHTHNTQMHAHTTKNPTKHAQNKIYKHASRPPRHRGRTAEGSTAACGPHCWTAAASRRGGTSALLRTAGSSSTTAAPAEARQVKPSVTPKRLIPGPRKSRSES